jgi:hypothetical protein
VPPVAQPHDESIPGLEVAVDGVDDDRLLERPLVTLLVEAHLKRLDGGRALAGYERAGLVFGRDVVRAGRIARLEQRPVGVELERRLEPGAVGHARGPDLVVEHHLGPLPGDETLDVARHVPEERQRLGLLVEARRGVVVAELLRELEIGHPLHRSLRVDRAATSPLA